MGDAFPVFDETGHMLGNQTSSQGVVPSSSNIEGITINGNNAGTAAGASIPQASAAAGITGGSVPPAATTGTASPNVANSWFTRAVIVILGFVFVAVGLSQFGVVQRLGGR
jgi:hypothetical protein